MPMWKSAIFRLGYRTNALLNALGLGNLKVARRLKQSVHKVLAHDPTVLISTQGFRMYIYADTATTKEYLAQTFEPETAALVARSVRPGATVLDIGAQFGYFSLIAARAAGPSGRVYAFEPVPKNFRLLERNAQLNRLANILPVQRAVGDRAAMAEMFVYGESDSHGMYRDPQAPVSGTVRVETVTIDEFLDDQPVDVIKMDIEGNEPHALTGMRRTIARSPNLVLFAELAPAYLRRGGTTPDDYLARLRALGFELRLIDEHSGELRPVTAELLAAAEQRPSWAANLYCRKTP